MKYTTIAAMVLAIVAVLSLTACNNSKASVADTEERDSTYTAVKHPQWSRSAVIYEVNLRQATESGTAREFRQKHLDRLKDLGVDILWFMPINPISEKDRKGTLGSYYAVRDYKAFNPEFGTLDDFKQLVDSAHAKGMKVILDWVPNHSGRDNVWVTEHPDWYDKDENGQMMGVYDWTDVYTFDYSNPEMRAGMVDAMVFWLREVDVDGFRCDVAMEVPTDFWNETRPQLQAVKPDLFMLAEATVPELQQQCFDMGYNWPLKDLFSRIAATAGQYTFKDSDGHVRKFAPANALDIDTLLAQQAEQFPRDTYLMNMTSNHDLNSWEGTEFQRFGELARPFAALSYMLPGMPLIYTGQEVGLDRALEFFEKDTPPAWDDDKHNFTAMYKALNELKHTQPALAAGEDGAPVKRYYTESPNVYVFTRVAADGKSGVAFIGNLGPNPEKIRYTNTRFPEEDWMEYPLMRFMELPRTLEPFEFHLMIVPDPMELLEWYGDDDDEVSTNPLSR